MCTNATQSPSLGREPNEPHEQTHKLKHHTLLLKFLFQKNAGSYRNTHISVFMRDSINN